MSSPGASISREVPDGAATDPIRIRELQPTDRPAAVRLRTEAFGPAMVPAADRPWPHPGSTGFGAFDSDGGDEQLIGTVFTRRYDSHFHGRLLRTCGIAGVTVAADRRGAGLLAPTLQRALAAQRDEGAVIATLFPSQPGIYRRFGFEVITECHWLEVPVTALRELSTAGDVGESASATVTVRRAGPADVADVRACYDVWATTGNGPLSRRGVSFPADDAELLDSVTELYLAHDADGRAVGYLAFDRAEGVGPETVVRARDLIASTHPARVALLRVLAGFDAVAGTVALRINDTDETLWQRRSGSMRRTPGAPYMLAVLDVVAACQALAPPPGLHGWYPITVTGPEPVGGRYRLEVSEGRVTCTAEPVGDEVAEAAVFSPRGLALWWSGAAGPSQLRSAGLLGGSNRHDDDLAALPGRRPIRILDAF